jgi:hypothetical protein
MGTTQLSAITKRPYYGLDYGAIVKAKAASLPAAYAATEDKEYRQKVLDNANAGVAIQQEAINVDKQAKEDQLKYYSDMTALSNEEAAAAKSNAATSNMLGVAGLGIGAYSAYNNSMLADKIATIAGVEKTPGLLSKGLTGIKGALGLNSSPAVTTPLAEAALASNPSTPALLTDASVIAAPETSALTTSTAAPIAAPTVATDTAMVATDVGAGLDAGTGAMVGDAGALEGVTAESLAGTSVTGSTAGSSSGFAGSSTVVGGVATVAALIAAALATKGALQDYAKGGEKESSNDALGYVANASQTPVNSVLTPGQALVDAGIVDEDTFFGQVVGLPGKLERAIMDPIGDALGLTGSCFVPGTFIEMEDGSVKDVAELELGDIVKEGGMVIGCGKSFAENIYRYLGQMLEGSHAAFENGRWLRVQDSLFAIKALDKDICVVCPIVTQNHLLVVNGRVYADLIETNQGWGVSEEDRIQYMNSQINQVQYLVATYGY